MSVAKITNKGYEVIFRRDGAYISKGEGHLSMLAIRKGDLYYLRENSECAIAQPTCSELVTWHARLGHLNKKDLLLLKRDGVLPSLDMSNEKQLSTCEVCLKGKMTSLPFSKNQKLCSKKLEIVHSDVVGPFRTEGTNHEKYFVTFIDDRTRWCEVYFLQEKSGVFEAFKQFQMFAEKHTCMKIKFLQTDNEVSIPSHSIYEP